MRISANVPGRAMSAVAASLALVVTALISVPSADASRPAAAVSAVPHRLPFAGRLAGLPRVMTLTTTVGGRRIVAVRQGPADAQVVILVLGQMHGSEPAGKSVVTEVRRRTPGPGVAIWTIRTMNPDGSAARTRQNARHVDLNRNFPQGWRGSYTSRVYFPGRRSASERETRAMMIFLNKVRPNLILSFHQAFNSIDTGNRRTASYSSRLARLMHLPTASIPCRGPCAGTLTGWYNTRYAGFAVTVELPRHVSRVLIRRAASAAVIAGTWWRTAPTPTPTPTPSPTPTPTPTITVTPSPTPSPSDTPTGGGAGAP